MSQKEVIETAAQASRGTERTETAERSYSAPRLFVIGKATDLVRSGYGYHPDSMHTSVNSPY
ncbi:MAG TPA: hypothetical protein VFU47_04780 [Armatimonadota bacterium]|nr:hypothetical protein [Armatimonadota bacterium]